MALILSVRGHNPIIPTNCFIAENATIIGYVTLGENCSVWFNTVVRGDVNSISVGSNSNIQDGAVIHCTYEKAATLIGSNVSIGHNALVHGCTVADNVLIGMGAIIMDHAVVQSFCIIAAGSIVLERTVCDSGYLYAGIPARRIKPITDEQREMLLRLPSNYIMYSSWFNPDREEL